MFDTQKVVVMDMTFADDGTVNVEEISQHSLDCDFSGMWTANGHYGLLVSNPSRQLSMLVAKTDTHEFAMLDIGVAAVSRSPTLSLPYTNEGAIRRPKQTPLSLKVVSYCIGFFKARSTRSLMNSRASLHWSLRWYQ